VDHKYIHRKYLRFAFQGIAYKYNRPFGYSLSPRTFSKCVTKALQPLHGYGMRVLIHLNDLVVMARSREWADVPHSPIDLTPNQVGGLRSIG